MFKTHKIEFLIRYLMLVSGFLFTISSWAVSGFETWKNENRNTAYSTIFFESIKPESRLLSDFDAATDAPDALLRQASGDIPAVRTTARRITSRSATTVSYFTPVYTGNGVDHMNINLVNLNQTGLASGDEIGIFDGIYCVGDAVINDNEMADNTISIAASANDTIESKPNGFIEGHTIVLKLYRAGMVYVLNYQIVNNTKNIFERNGSMFALVNFTQSVDLETPNPEETVKLYPNPFDNQLTIQVTLPQRMTLNVDIFDQRGVLIRNLYHAEESGQVTVTWDGKDGNMRTLPSGIYFCRINGVTKKVIFKPGN